MQFEETDSGAILIMKPLGRRIDAATAAAFKGEMVDRINSGRQRIVLDLSEVDFIDSSGLGAMVSSLKAIGDGGDLVLCGVRETVMSLFRLTRMNRVFSMFGDREEAVRSLKAS
jgi:anti-sigma B factor antagonist